MIPTNPSSSADNNTFKNNLPIENHIPFSKLNSTSGNAFSNTTHNANLPSSKITANLKKEIQRLENNPFSKELSPDSNEQKIRDTLKNGGYLSSAFSGGIAMLISTGVSVFATKTIGAGLASVTLATCVACGAIGGAGFGAWLGFKFANELSTNHPGAAGMALAVGWTVLGAPLAVGVFALAGAAKGFGLGMTGAFFMSQAVGFGAFKLSLIVLEPLAQKLIADPRIMKVKMMLEGVDLPSDYHKVSSDLTDESNSSQTQTTDPFTKEELAKLKSLEFSEDDMEKLTKFCKEPLGYSIDYWYNNIFSPPLHKDLKNFAHYVDWTPNNEIDSLNETHDATAEKAENSSWETVIAVIQDIGSGIKGLFTSPMENKSKTWQTIEHASQTALHRATFQVFRRNTNKTYNDSNHPLKMITQLAENGAFINANQAWENFHQMERRFGRDTEGKKLSEAAKVKIRANYGAEPTLLETLTCGWYTSGRLQQNKGWNTMGHDSHFPKQI